MIPTLAGLPLERGIMSVPQAVFKLSGFTSVQACFDPYSAGIRAYLRREPFDPDFSLGCKGWGANSAQCLYERDSLAAAANPSLKKTTDHPSRPQRWGVARIGVA
jgi:hypothetical protein